MKVSSCVGLADPAVPKSASACFALSACIVMGVFMALLGDPLRPGSYLVHL